MKLPAKIVLKIGVGLVGALALTLVLNESVRISDGETSYGFIEEKLFGESFASKLSKPTKSENLRKWDESSAASEKLTRMLRERGKGLITDTKLDAERLRAHTLATRAFTLSSSLPKEYLSHSNPDLPEGYSKYFASAMADFAAGLETKNEALIADGVQKYNQSHPTAAVDMSRR